MSHFKQTSSPKKTNVSKKMASADPPAQVIPLEWTKTTTFMRRRMPLPDQPVIHGIVFIKQNHAFIKLELSHVKHIVAKDNYIEIFTSQQHYLVRGTMKEIGASLPVQFVRVHRSHFINTLYLDSFATDYAVVNGCSVPVGPDYYQKLIERVTILGS